MFLSAHAGVTSRWRCFVVWLLLLSLASVPLLNAWAQQSSAPASAGGAGSGFKLVFKICEPPPMCFLSAGDRQNWAAQNNCQFLEDVCEKTPAAADNKGAKPEDQGFWGDLWDGIAGGLQYGYEFAKGLFAGLKGQVTDLIELISNPLEVVQGLIELGKAFYNDPKGTLKALGELLGQEAVDMFTRATQCGAHDLGKLIGSYVSPAVALKLASKLNKYGGKLADAVKATKLDLGCASFVAGTPVLTPQGLLPIERIGKGSAVLSRDDKRWSDAPQAVEQTFGRVAPGYRLLQTERETFRLTDEHPVWVQGKGWTKALDVTDEDVLASLSGDVLVRSNEPVLQPVRVYNFSVAHTPSYFVGESGLWVHNAKCNLPPLPSHLASDATELAAQADLFKRHLVNLSPGERVALIKSWAKIVADTKAWLKDNKLTRINNRDVYRSPDEGLYALDTRHGEWEVINPKNGAHQGAVQLLDFSPIKDSLDASGGHDLKLN